MSRHHSPAVPSSWFKSLTEWLQRPSRPRPIRRRRLALEPLGTRAVLSVAPVASEDYYELDQDGALEICGDGVLGNDHDEDGDALTAVLIEGPAHGSLVLNEDGSFSYTPDAGFSGGDSFLYAANDGESDSAAVAVSLFVNSSEDENCEDEGDESDGESEEEESEGDDSGDNESEEEESGSEESYGDDSEGDESEGDESEGDDAEGDESTGDESEQGDDSEEDESEGEESETENEIPVITDFSYDTETGVIYFQGTVADDQDCTGYTVYLSGLFGDHIVTVEADHTFYFGDMAYDSGDNIHGAVWAYVVDSQGAQSESWRIVI